MTERFFVGNSEAETKNSVASLEEGKNLESDRLSNSVERSDIDDIEDASRQRLLESEEMAEEAAEAEEMTLSDLNISQWLGKWQGVLIGLILGIVATGGVMQFLGRQSQATPDAQLATQSTEVAQKTPQAVTVAPVEVATVQQTLEGTGTITAYDLLPVLSQVNGLQIKQVLVTEGDTVTKGQVMAILDDSVLRSQLAEAVAGVQSAEATADRATSEVQQAQSTQNEARAGIDQAKAGVVQAKADALQAIAIVEQAKAGVSQAKAGVVQANAGVAQARANLEQAQREVDRAQNLASEGVISQQDLEKRRVEAKTALENVNKAQADLNRANEELNKALEEVRVAEAGVINAQADIKTAEALVNSATAKFQTAGTNIRSAKANVGNTAANIRSSEARVQQLQTQLEQTVVRAPENGIVSERIARVGNVTNGSQKLFSIIRSGKLELQVKVPETQLPQIKVGAPVQVTSDTDSRIVLQGTVREIAPNLDPQNRQATVKVDLPSISQIRESPLRPGLFLRAAIATASSPGLKVPAKALQPLSNGKATVFRLVGENQVRAQSVEVGEVFGAKGRDLSGATVVIKSGLKAGDRVVVEGVESLKDGDSIRVVSENGVPVSSQL